MAGASRETAASARPPHRERRSLDTFAPNLSAPFANAEFEFRSRTLNGQDQQAPRWRAIGAVIGHEMGHRFDDQGRRSDAKGELRDWWTAEDAANYEARATRIAEQFAAYEALPGRTAPVLDGFTGEQRFFIGWAQVWRSKRRDDALRALVLSDPHSPDKFRTNGPVSNMDAFYAAFGVVEGDRLWVAPARRTTIW